MMQNSSASRRISNTLAVIATLLACGSAPAQLPAFPGAEGFGGFSKGGRGGEVYYVTHLNDSGPGSFRDGVSKPDRTIVFDAGGVITISSRIIVAPRITIAGQTAPGGVTVYGNGVSFTDSDETIVRHIRFRMGVKGDSGKDCVTLARGRNMIFDHVSIAWGRDENFSINGVATNITIQDSIVAQGLQHHSAGGLIQTSGGVSILRTLYADNHTRNPKVKGVNQYVNNVVYNWGRGGCYILGDSDGPSFANVMHNYFIAGPNTGAAPFTRGNENFRIFAEGNFFDGNRDGSLNGQVIPRADYGVVSWREQPFDYPQMRVLNAQQALRTVLGRAGAWPRDAVDAALIQEVRSFGTAGQIITNEMAYAPVMPARVTSETVVDTDRDGMPDDWEKRAGLNPNDAADRNQRASSGYTRLEEYLNGKADALLADASGSDDTAAAVRSPAGAAAVQN
ncbi:MAG TPA: pectate lyase [Verrucomicrobiae bacterium]|nr:pectate lyase [Verrucomicrobiae bacterium]